MARECEHSKAGIPLETRQLERGKSETYCPLCEDAANERLAAMFAGVEVNRPVDFIERIKSRFPLA